MMEKEYWAAGLGRGGRNRSRCLHIFRYPEVKSLCGKGPPGYVPFPGDLLSLGDALWVGWGKAGLVCKLCKQRAQGILSERSSQ